MGCCAGSRPGLFWVTVLLAALLGISRAFSIEAEHGAHDGLRLSGLDGSSIFLGKAAALALELLVFEALLTVGVVVLFDVRLGSLVPLVLATLAATVGLAAAGTLYGVLAAGIRGARDAGAGAAAPCGRAGAARCHPRVGGLDRRRHVRRLAVGRVARDLRRVVRRNRDAGLRAAAGGIVSAEAMTDEAATTHRTDDRFMAPVARWIVGIAALVSLATLVVVGLFVAPPDAVQGDAQRLMYLHVPVGMARLPRVRRHRARVGALPRAPHALARVGPRRRRVGRAGRDLHRPHPGARLALGPTGVGCLVGVGRAPRHHRGPLLPLPRLPRAAAGPGGGRRAAAKRCAIAALVAFVDVPIVHFSVEWWRTLHQKATVFNPELDAKIHGTMALALWIGVLAFTLLYVYLLDRGTGSRPSRRAVKTRELEARDRRTGSARSAPRVNRWRSRRERRRLRHRGLGDHRRRARSRTSARSCGGRGGRSGLTR